LRTLSNLFVTAMMLLQLLGSLCHGSHSCSIRHTFDEKHYFNRNRLISEISQGHDQLAQTLRASWNLGKTLATKADQDNQGRGGQFPNFPVILYGLCSGCQLNLDKFCLAENEKRIFLNSSGLLIALDSKFTTHEEMILVAAGWDSVAARLNASKTGYGRRGCFASSHSIQRIVPFSNTTIGLILGLAAVYGVLDQLTISCGLSDSF
jgi:hypothetical protein